jgi:pyruvate dehydrogenase (quinone)
LMVGTGFPWSEFLPKDGRARAVQIDIDASMLSLRYPVEINLHGDAADTLNALLPLIRRNDDRAGRIRSSPTWPHGGRNSKDGRWWTQSQ